MSERREPGEIVRVMNEAMQQTGQAVRDCREVMREIAPSSGSLAHKAPPAAAKPDHQAQLSMTDQL